MLAGSVLISEVALVTVSLASVIAFSISLQASSLDWLPAGAVFWVAAELDSDEGVADEELAFSPPHAARLSGIRVISMAAAMRCFMGSPLKAWKDTLKV